MVLKKMEALASVFVYTGCPMIFNIYHPLSVIIPPCEQKYLDKEIKD